MLILRPPRHDEAETLTDLCLRSKAVWGYDEQFMGSCRSELTLTAGTMRASHMRVAELDGCVVGVVQVTVTGELAELDKLFVEPRHLRCGAGRELFDWARTTARVNGAATLTIDADPGAAGFYRRMGAVDDGLAASASIPGRFIPKLRLAL